MGNLESIAKGTGSSLLATGLDPIGKLIQAFDYLTTGKGECDKDALPTLSNEINKGIYKDSSKKIETKDMATRYIAKSIGTTIVAGAYIGAYLTAPIALAIPVATGLYSTIASGIRYIKDALKPKEEKSTFMDGFKLGYEQTTSFLGADHYLESSTTGRGLKSSHMQSPIREAAQKTQRNFTSILGNLCGKTIGLIASAISLSYLPIHKTIRDRPKALGSLTA